MFIGPVSVVISAVPAFSVTWDHRTSRLINESTLERRLRWRQPEITSSCHVITSRARHTCRRRRVVAVMGKSQIKTHSKISNIFFTGDSNLQAKSQILNRISHTKILNPQTPNLKSNLKTRNNEKALANIFQFYWFRPMVTMVTIGISIFGAALLRALISPFKASPDNNRERIIAGIHHWWVKPNIWR